MKNVTLKITTIEIPTYGIGESPTTPIFYEGRANQGAQGHVYPYALQDTLSDQVTMRKWKSIVLENEYVHYEILPELGGRIFRAVDKTNGYDFFYRQDVIKPALIGVLGAWMSGGVEWNFPHHHRTTTFMPADWRTEKNRDGSATVWIAETERRQELRSEVALTLMPGCSVLKVNLHFTNKSELPQSFLYWANCAVHANEQYQVIFPPDVYYAIHHAKDACCSWPIFDGDYKGIHFDHCDLSWWKNHPSPASFFCGASKEDFFGGYDHGKDAGVVIWADHNVAPGKKFFLWGNNERARVWDQMLTDDNGPYLELMAGCYSDNQPDYSWLQPGEEKIAMQNFFPVHSIGGFKFATIGAAVNVTSENGGVWLSAIGTMNYPEVTILLEKSGETSSRHVWNVPLAPDKPFKDFIPDMKGDDLLIQIVNPATRGHILYYHHHPYPERPMPTLTVPPAKPETFATTEQLYLAAQRLEQFHNPILSCEPYYEEVLKRDPDDYRTNLAVGIRKAKRGLWQEALEHFQKAQARAEYNNTTPQDGSLYYYLGLAQRNLGLWNEAMDNLMKAGTYGQYNKITNRAMMKTAVCLGGKRDVNPMLKQRCYRMLSRNPNELYEEDDYNHWNPDEALLLKLCIAYDMALWSFLTDDVPVSSKNTLIHYYRGYGFYKMQNLAQAKQCFKKAAALSADYCFPHHWQTEFVLKAALECNPKDAQAGYLLGCLLRYEERHEEALAYWEQAAANGSTYGNLYYCLGHAYEKAKRLDEAKAMYEKAIAVEADNPIFVREYDKLAESRNVEPAERLAFLQARQDVVCKRDDVLLREIVLLNRIGDFDGALKSLGDRRFYVWEGNEVIVHDAYVEAHMGRGQLLLKNGEAAKAREDFEAALLYPAKLGVGKPYRDIKCRETQYWIGQTYKAEGRKADARKAFEESVSDMVEPSASERLILAKVPYYQALSLRELGRKDEADALFKKIAAVCRKALGGGDEKEDFFAKFSATEAAAPKQKLYLELLKAVEG